VTEFVLFSFRRIWRRAIQLQLQTALEYMGRSLEVS